MAFTRRQFIKRTGLATAGAFLGPSLFRNPLLRRVLADQLDTLDRYLVIIFLEGGNDGLNTVVPLGDSGASQLRFWYEQARSLPTGQNPGGLQLSPTDLAATQIGTDPNTGTPLALHPGLVGLRHLWDAGALAVVQGCGDPNSLNFLSHEFSQTVWESGNPFSVSPGYPGGWLGRYMGASYGPTDIPGVCIRDSIAGEFATSATSVLAMTSVADFGFPYDDWDLDSTFGPNNITEMQFKHDAFSGLYTNAKSSAQPTFQYLGASGTATLGASDSYPTLDDLYTNDPNTLNNVYQNLIDNGNGFASDIREVAKIIHGVIHNTDGAPYPANVKARAFELSNGGYDTHSNQGTTGANDQQNQLHQMVGDALEVFYNDCKAMGVEKKVCVMIWSEFSRRIQQNSSGTDHGSQAPVFVIGGAVNGGPGAPNGGVYGNHPNINSDQNIDNSYGGNGALNGDGNTVYSQAPTGPNPDPTQPYRATDIRDVYGTILKHWLNVDPTALLPPDSGDPTQYWTVPNFDIGFLP